MENTNVDLSIFIENFRKQFDNPILEDLMAETKFRDLPEWTSLQALIIIVSLDSDYGVTVTAEQLQKMHTIQDLFQLVTNDLQN